MPLGAAAAGEAPAVAPPTAAAGAALPVPEAIAFSTSALITRPCGPEPWVCAMSRPASLARRRASGEENTRLPSAPDDAGVALTADTAAGAGAAWAGAAAGLSPAGDLTSVATGAAASAAF